MNDESSNLINLRKKIAGFIIERDWEKFHHPKELAISISIEASELLEIFQWEEKEDLEKLKKNSKKIAKIREEVADVIIYSLSLANRLDIDVTQSVLEKIAINEKKYPIEKVKGKADKYTKYLGGS